MAQFALLVWGPSDGGERHTYETAEEFDAQMRATGEFNADLQAEGRLAYVNGFGAAADGTYVDGRSGEAVASPGPYAGGAESVNGLWVIEAQDRDEAVALAARASAACQRVIEVRTVGG
ncbi:YciI family protein [Demequina sp. NBRC 110052]|uniref:YciI family protein n=1 Tax=Demequina sp. NBRC 110052 TaxID=1570341 RepID=UPI000A045F0C|nr:YciI family protein [Demequina sp. NBRC 110052]